MKIRKITNLLTMGQIKLYMGPVNKNLKKKIQNFDFWMRKLDFCKKKIANAIKKWFTTPLCTYIKRSVLMSRISAKLSKKWEFFVYNSVNIRKFSIWFLVLKSNYQDASFEKHEGVIKKKQKNSVAIFFTKVWFYILKNQ